MHWQFLLTVPVFLESPPFSEVGSIDVEGHWPLHRSEGMARNLSDTIF